MTTGSPLQIDFVSPLPPVRSGIADYSADLLPELDGICDLRLVALDDQPVSEELRSRWRPVTAAALAHEESSHGRLPLYQMGNNQHHEQVHALAARHPGVVTLHDIFIHHLLQQETLGKGELAPYQRRLEDDHGWIGAAVALPPRWGAYGDAPLFALPCHRTLARSQRGILVHSKWGAELLREESQSENVRVVPMPMPLGRILEAEEARRFRLECGVPEAAPLLGSFGFQTPIKRTDVVVRALARSGMEAVHLLVVGEIAPQMDLEEEARKAGVADRVHIRGYVTRDELQLAMAAVDLFINLRFPTAGETSASLLRLFAQGRPAVVSEYAQFADLPDDVVLKVPLGADEEEQLALGVCELLSRPDRLEAMGRAARDLIRTEHAPPKAARAILEACSELADREPLAPLPLTTPPPSTLTCGRISGRLEVDGLRDGEWQEGESRRINIRLQNDGPARWLAGHRGTGGVVLEIQLQAGGIDQRAGHAWPALPRDVEPGEAVEVGVMLRRPPGESTLRIEPHVLGYTSFGALGGPVFEKTL